MVEGEMCGDVQAHERLQIELHTSERINFASAQNDVAVIKSVTLKNVCGEDLRDLRISVTSAPSFARSKTWNIDRLPADDELKLKDIELSLDHAFLANLNEAERGSLNLHASIAGEPELSITKDVELLSRDEWGGLGEMASILAAYVSPNTPVVASVLKEASRLLERSGHDGAIDGYQRKDPGRVWMVAGAIWSALTSLSLSYAVPPASFENRGQKIRSAARIKSEGLATCLDSALLTASCFEAAGLNPVVLFSDGHAWTGLWLTERDFGSISEPDVVTVRKAADAREFILIETTFLTKRPTIGLEDACHEGRAHLNEEREHEFRVAVDISRARATRIRPLADSNAAVATDPDDSVAVPAALPRPMDFGRLPGELVEIEPTDAEGRISRWQRKLLDLSLRNRLLNFKETKQTLPFVCPNVAALEDQLAEGKSFKMLALKDEDPVGARDLLATKERETIEHVASDAFARGQVAVQLTSKEMERRLIELYRRAKSDLQEGGTNTLFLAAGFLRWRKSDGDDRTYRAPLLLIPVKLDRRSAKSDFTLEHHEDEVRFNSTLLEFLKRDYHFSVPELEGDLPRDESGIDIPLVFEIMRRHVRDVPGFEIVEDLSLSTFSFAKFLMWKDLVDRTDSLRESKLVRHLVDSPEDPFLSEDSVGLPSEHDVDRRKNPSDFFTPLPADSSQLAAVLAAEEGHDFVLIGPPGTGKSQTIANIIAQCLAVGKTVLFVAEKSAALQVVHRRLSAIGLEDAVLELHSNKADRKSVLAQLGRSWNRGGFASDEKWQQITEDLRVTRDELNSYVEALHKKGTPGFSIFEAIGRLSAFGEATCSLAFESKDAHDQQSYRHLCQLAEEAGRCWQIVEGMEELKLVDQTEWSYGWQAELLSAATQLQSTTRRLTEAKNTLVRQLGLKVDLSSEPRKIRDLAALHEGLASSRNVSWGLERDLGLAREQANTLASLLEKYEAAQSNLSSVYQLDNLSNCPLDQMDIDWRQSETKFWPMSALSKRKVRKLLQTYAVSGEANPESDISALITIRELRRQVEAVELAECPAFEGVETNLTELSEWLQDAETTKALLRNLDIDVEERQTWIEAKALIAAKQLSHFQVAFDDFAENYASWVASAEKFAGLSKIDPRTFSLAEIQAELAKLAEEQQRLTDWAHWRSAYHAASAAGLKPLLESFEDSSARKALQAFEAAYASWWLPLAMDASDKLRRFAHWSHEDQIKTFRELDQKAADFCVGQILNRIDHGLPAKDTVPRKSELGTLRHQMGLQRPSMPIRTLVSEMPDTFRQLAPCVLMSPLSVAQYLPANQATFDVVVFDEASQITTWDAIGAIARGRQAIIVGDPKQLPPTNFFGRADDSDDDLPEYEKDLSSILDEVVAAGIPTKQLDWHYRSRDESLIAFSNWHYYGGRLVTFPSPATSSMAIELHQIDGIYARGKGRTNDDEARAIVELIVGRLEEALRLPQGQRLTYGVITFNGEQQKLILDLLDAERRKNPALEWFFADDREEPVIVKNLENIQGDERDVMLFSITFGTDHAGKLSMALGALNVDGGEKRLNVAVTRARRELHVFASISADQIDLSRTGALGVKHLKAFLDYCSRGTKALPEANEGSLGPTESDFEDAVLAAIQARGWEVRPQIGVSGFRIDLGVVHPDKAGVFLAGIECDGATYHRSATARDRDKVRQGVLEGLGWNILRVWSTDWFKHAQSVSDRIHTQLNVLLSEDRERDLAKEAVMTNKASEEQGVGSDPINTAPTVDAPAAMSPTSSSAAMEIFQRSPDSAPSEDDANRLDKDSSGEETGQDSVEHHLRLSAERFFEQEYAAVLKELVSSLVINHGPLPLSLLAKQVANAHGWQRTGRRIFERVTQCLDNVDCHDEFGTTFVWPHDGYVKIAPFRFRPDRSLRETSRSEIAGLIAKNSEILARSDDAVLELARLAGVSRLSADSRVYLEDCIDWHMKVDGTYNGEQQQKGHET